MEKLKNFLIEVGLVILLLPVAIVVCVIHIWLPEEPNDFDGY